MVNSVQRLKALQFHLVLLGVSITAIIAALFLLWFDVASQPYIPGSFSYSADAIGTKTLYNPDNGQPLSEEYIKTKLQYNLVGIDTIQSELESSSVTGDLANLSTREDKIDLQNGVFANPSNNTYLLGPKNAQKDQDFSFRFPAYDATATMKFEAEESLLGVKTYRYDARYGRTVQGQIDAKKVAFAPSLKVWIEPTTGWLVKFQEDTALYSAGTNDTATNPAIGRLTNRTTEESVRQHATYAKAQKTRFAFAQQVAPSIILTILLVGSIAFAISRMKALIVPVYGSITVVAGVAGMVFLGWILQSEPLVTAIISPTAMNPLTAVCFILVALAIAALYKGRRYAVAFVGGIVAILAGLQLLSGLGSLPFAVDLLFFRDAVLELDQTLSSRMSIYAAFTFLVLGITLVKAGFTTQRSEVHFAKFTSGIALSLGVFGLLLQLTQIDKALSINFIQSMSFLAPALFIICSYTLMQLFRSIHDKPDDIRSTLSTLRWPSIATIPLIVIGIFAQIQQNNVKQSLVVSFNEKTASFEAALNNQVGIYANTVAGTRALFSASQTVAADEFKKYVNSYDGKARFAGLESLGYAQLSPSSQQSITNPYTNSNATIFPETSNSTVTPVTFIESQDSNKDLVGFDLNSTLSTQEALNRARDTGRTILSTKATIPMTKNEPQVDRNLLVSPIYSKETPATVEERRRSITGYVFGTLTINDLFNNLTSDLEAINVDVYDGLTAQSETRIYSSLSDSATRYIPRIAEVDSLFLAYHPLTLAYSTSPDFQLSPQEEFSPTLVLVGGSLTYFAIVAILYFLVNLERTGRLKTRIGSSK